MVKSQRIGLALGVAALAAAAATAFAVPAKAHVQATGATKPGAWCGASFAISGMLVGSGVQLTALRPVSLSVISFQRLPPHHAPGFVAPVA